MVYGLLMVVFNSVVDKIQKFLDNRRQVNSGAKSIKGRISLAETETQGGK
jgi:hypothetical protein